MKNDWLPNQMGSVDDIRTTLKGSGWSIDKLEAAMKDENSKDTPRKTVVKLLESAIKRKKREVQP
ncbi:hypothetical protein D770_20420 [Flammeovirgaceae bacterium 311]|nr:hypothetical protein D770_20420 [Flammeovirgaceae bacterium 311]